MSEIFDPTSAIGSATAGFACTLLTSFVRSFLDMSLERQQVMLDILKGKTLIQDESADKANLRDPDVGKWIRRLIYGGCAFSIILAPFIFAFFSDISVEVENRQIAGGWLWGMIPEYTDTVFHQVKGFYLPDSIQTAFISYLIPFYLGRGAAK